MLASPIFPICSTPPNRLTAQVTDVVAHPLSLPRLELGPNTLEYTDESPSRDVLIEQV